MLNPETDKEGLFRVKCIMPFPRGWSGPEAAAGLLAAAPEGGEDPVAVLLDTGAGLEGVLPVTPGVLWASCL